MNERESEHLETKIDAQKEDDDVYDLYGSLEDVHRDGDTVFRTYEKMLNEVYHYQHDDVCGSCGSLKDVHRNGDKVLCRTCEKTMDEVCHQQYKMRMPLVDCSLCKSQHWIKYDCDKKLELLFEYADYRELHPNDFNDGDDDKDDYHHNADDDDDDDYHHNADDDDDDDYHHQDFAEMHLS